MSELSSAIAGVSHAGAAALVHRDVFGINYHLVSPEAPPHITGILPCKTPDQFEQDLLFLKRHYHVVSYPDVLASRSGGPPLPKRAMMISFDDGFRECYEYVRPLLLKHAMPCCFFLITDSVNNRALAFPNRIALCLNAMRSCSPELLGRAHDAARDVHGIDYGNSPESLYQALHALTIQDIAVLDTIEDAFEIDAAAYLRDRAPYLTAQQIDEMLRDGFTFGGHTKTHPQLWLVGDERFEAEIAGSCEAVCALTGEKAAPFAFPYRSNGVERQRLKALRARHAHIGLMFDSHGWVRDAPFMVPRLSFDDPKGTRPNRSNLASGLNRGYLALAAKTLLGRGRMD